MSVALSREAVLQLFCTCREAERSVHRALSDPWPDFRDYYSDPKRSAIRALLETLAPGMRQQSPLAAGDGCSGRALPIPALGPFRLLIGRWIAPWRKAWSFRTAETHFIASALDVLLGVLASPARPDPDALIALRMRLFSCQLLIQARCPGLAALERAKGIDHFNKTKWLPSVTLSDILKDCA